jgi:predicted transcriptional regulator
MKDAYMTIKLDTPLRERVEALAQAERRSLADQAAYLMEKGLAALEHQKQPEPAVEARK